MVQKVSPFVLRRHMWFGALLLLFPFFAATAGEMTSTLMIGGSRIDVTIETKQYVLNERRT